MEIFIVLVGYIGIMAYIGYYWGYIRGYECASKLVVFSLRKQLKKYSNANIINGG